MQGLGSFTVDTSSVGSPVLWTLSQPYGARNWWPCQQALGYKLDSLTLVVRVPKPYKAVSNGLLLSTRCIDTLCTYTWHTRYPIAPYLVAVSVAEYVTHTLDLTPQAGVPLLSRNHLYPADSARFAVDINNRLPGILQVFTQAFGTYPFAEEGCNHAQFTFRGGMEHQTCSFMFNFGFDLTAHELAHQWFGDLVTCGSWSELWLNEGFATWAELYAVELLEPERLVAKRQGDIRRAMANRTGTVLEQDTLNVRHLFNSALRYDKPGIILHQLRHWLGDTCFFNALKAYLGDRYHRFGFSRTRGLQHYLQLYCSKALDDYFQVWLAGPGYPKLVARWQQQRDGNISILLEQLPPQPGLPCLRVPFELRLEGTRLDGQPCDTLIRIEDSCQGLPWFGKTNWKVDRVELDPFIHWMIDKEVMPQAAVSTFAVLVAPNPAKTELAITWAGSGQSAESIELIDAVGRTVQSIRPDPQENRILVPIQELGRGLYWIRVRGTRGGLHFSKIVLE
jgi:aminopeptidase N